MGTMVSGDHQMANQCPFQHQIKEQNDINMVMQNFEQGWQNSEGQVMEQLQKEQIMMEQAFAQAQLHDNALMQEMMAKCPHLQQNWQNATEAQMQEQWADELHQEVVETK